MRKINQVLESLLVLAFYRHNSYRDLHPSEQASKHDLLQVQSHRLSIKASP